MCTSAQEFGEHGTHGEFFLTSCNGERIKSIGEYGRQHSQPTTIVLQVETQVADSGTNSSQ